MPEKEIDPELRRALSEIFQREIAPLLNEIEAALSGGVRASGIFALESVREKLGLTKAE